MKPYTNFQSIKNFKYSIVVILTVVLASCHNNDMDFDASGVFEAEELIISAEATGKILSFSVEEGQNIQANMAVANIDCENISLQKSQILASKDALKLKQNDADPQVRILRAQAENQRANLAIQRQQLAVLDKERARVQNLVNQEAAPTKQLDDIQGQIDVLRRQLESTQSQIAVTNQQIASQIASTKIQNRGILSETQPLNMRIKQIDDQLSKCQVINPIAGTVLVKYAATNELITMGKPLYKIADMSNMTLRAYIAGSQLSKIKLNQPVKVFISNGEKTYKELPGTVLWISNKSEFTPKTIQTKNERENLVYATKIRVKNDGFVKIGMYGEVKFQ